jgi:hypothetical protein
MRVDRRLLAGIASAALFVLTGLAATPASAAVTTPEPWVTGDPVFTPPARVLPVQGVVYHGMWSELTDTSRGQLLDRLAANGVKWVRMDVAWREIQPAGPDSYDLAWGVPQIEKRLDEISARGMKTLLMFWWAPKWSSGSDAANGIPRNADEYGRAAAWVANRWKDKISAIEIWNEPDQDAYLLDDPSSDKAYTAVTYTNLLKASYPRIKAVNPTITVVAGAPTAVNVAYYTKVYANGGAGMFDALGIHPYSGITDKPMSYCDPSQPQWYPCNIPNLITLMKAHGDGNKKLWATEYGWSTHDNSTYTSPVPNWKRGVTAQQQADYILSAQTYLSQFPQVEASFIFTARNGASGDAQLINFGLMNRDLTPKLGLRAVKCATTGICGPSTATGITGTAAKYVKSGDSWRVDDTGLTPASTWTARSFDDSAWRPALTQLGYGEGDERTVLKFGADPLKKPVAYYARAKFDAGVSIGDVKALQLRTIVDDGAIVYLNGKEIWRYNMPTGSVSNGTPAASVIVGTAETTWQQITLPVTGLTTGVNQLAVQVHQSSASSSDLSLDVELAPVR